ncbi:helix-turn-helix transcriptional regulator [Listeria booriae]|uniref:Helix-turn-helix transcriptional regulator n=1 Tax=Listeria booriae TaxID=1552123 RepID=A0A7X1DPV9_9LIST|nr:helix-turn-helix transcriptional regulator [Listeria booriae]MBC2370569.1 helix-turn-helix transcriptional regulator [Listeria booriae]
MVNIQKLKGIIVEKETTQGILANVIGVDRSTFYRKLREGGSKLTVEEVEKICKYLKLETGEMLDIFFNNIGA